jgi:hypothetical protein
MDLAPSTKTIGRPKHLQDYSYNIENPEVQYLKIPRNLRIKFQAVLLLDSCKMGPISYPEKSATTNLRCVTSQKSEGLKSMWK